MKMRFWQKTYLLTLAVFLLCLNIGILSLTVYTYGKNVEAMEATAKAEQTYAAMNFERDFGDLNAANAEMSSPSLLMQSYGSYYGAKGVFVAFEKEGEILYSNFKNTYKIGENQLLHKDLDGKRHILISSAICEGEYVLVYARDVSALDREFRSLMVTYGVTAAGVSVFLAAALYFILKKLSAPLEKLRQTTELIQAGDYTVTAEEGGSDEFTLLAQSFNAMIGKINEQMKALELDARKKQMLVDNLAHELRTPLTSIQGYGEFLEKASASEESRIDAARYILSEARRLEKISETLLDSAFIRGNPPEKTRLDAGAVLADVARRLQLRAEKAQVEFCCEPGQLWTEGNETLLSMLFYNLAENAIKACAPGGRVGLYCQENQMIVEDNGKGMTQEQLLHITEPFYRTDKSRSRAQGGAGLGLALCRQIAQLHGTSLEFASEVGKGTKVSVSFTTPQ